MKNPFKKKKIENLADYNNISVTRYPFDSWMKSYPESNYDEYDSRQIPKNLMEYLCLIYIAMSKKAKFNDDSKFNIVCLDDDYYKWIEDGNKKDDEITRSSYAVNVEYNNKIQFNKLDKEHLNVSIWMYAMPLIGTSESKSIDSHIDRKTADSIANYFQKVINDDNFSVYVAPFFLEGDVYEENAEQILSLAESWFYDHMRIKLGKFEEIRLQENNTLGMYYIPVIIMERHTSSSISVNEIKQYLGHDMSLENLLKNRGRFIDVLAFNQEGIEKSGIDITEFEFSKAGILLNDELKTKFNKEAEVTIFPFLVGINDLEELYNKFVDAVTEEAKKLGIICN